MEAKLKDQTHLSRRGAIYYFRRRVPSELVAHYGKAELTYSLKTTILKEAQEKARLEGVRWDQEFHQIRSFQSAPAVVELSPLEIDRLAGLFCAKVLSDDEFIRADGRLSPGDMYSLYGKAIEKFTADDAVLVARGVSGADVEMESFLKERGVTLAPDTELYRKVAYAFAKARKRAGDATLERQRGQVIDTPTPEPFALRSLPQASTGDTLGALLDYWETQGSKRLRTIAEAGHVIGVLQALHPGRPASRFDAADVVTLKDNMLKAGNAPATVRKKLGLLKAVFQTAVDNKKITTNPAAGIKVPRIKVSAKSRISFSLDDLQAIFSSTVFTQGARPAAGKGEAAFWVPLIGLWTGARLEEIGQLRLADIREERGVHYFHITPDAGSLKTASSRRRVPVHSELLKCGLLEYVASLKAQGHHRLFPLLQSGEGRQLTATLSQWWGRYLRKVVKVTDTRKVFHSFRHGFKDACRDSRIEKEYHDQLTGHVSGDVGDDYGSEDYPLGPLSDAIRVLCYRGLDLSHLHKAGVAAIPSGVAA